ncbi:MAG: hypothetical protein Q7T34_02445 [Candidatus Parcubacteria bacterium]|nr:hypothetical protein [Candidatus Parcubacteria bacterium]
MIFNNKNIIVALGGIAAVFLIASTYFLFKNSNQKTETFQSRVSDDIINQLTAPY